MSHQFDTPVMIYSFISNFFELPNLQKTDCFQLQSIMHTRTKVERL